MPDGNDEQPSLGFLLVRLGEAVDQRFVAALERLQLRPRELRALVLVDRYRGSSQRELARRLDVDPGNLVDLLDRLEARGLISRNAALDDRRRRALQLTPAGSRLLKRAVRATQDAEHQVLAPLSDDEWAKLEGIALHLWQSNAERDAPDR